MPLYVGFDCSTQSFSAIVIEIDGDLRRVVFQHSLNFDRDFPAYKTRSGVRHGREPGEVFAPPLMWAAALDRMMAAVAQAPEVDVSADPSDLRVGPAARQRLPERHGDRSLAGAAREHGAGAANRRNLLARRRADLDGREHDGAMPGDRSRAGRPGGDRTADRLTRVRTLHWPADSQVLPAPARCLRQDGPHSPGELVSRLASGR